MTGAMLIRTSLAIKLILRGLSISSSIVLNPTGKVTPYRMEEPEVPLEHLHEHVHETAEHSGERWISWVALSTAILAVLAAIASLLSGQHANEAMMNQIESSDQWGYYQAKSIKAAVLDAKMSLAASASEEDRRNAARYEEEQTEIQRKAREKETEARSNFHRHEVYARAVAMFQIAIAVAAISALTKKRHFWIVGLLFGVAGCIFLAFGMLNLHWHELLRNH